MSKLAYYASRIAPDKPHQFETAEGYRIYTSVPICRSGFQDYLGKELKSHPDYDPAWDIGDDDVVKVYRPREVVTAPETIASFEGKSVTDGHPPDDVALVMVETEGEYGRGHVQNVRVGQLLEDNETPLLADLFVKNQPLNDKIDGGVRDVSCGYVYNLKRLDDGTFAMTRICGNHVAVVPKGRAGAEVSIRDEKPAALAAETTTTKTKEKEPTSMKNNSLFGRMLKAFAKDAEPEEVAEAAKLSHDSEEPTLKKKEGVNYDTDFYWDAANQKAVPIRGSKGYSKRKAGDGAEEMVEEMHPDLKQFAADVKTALDAIAKKLGIGGDSEPGEEKVVDPAAEDATVLEMTGEEQGKGELPKQIAAADSTESLTAIRPKVVAAKDAAITKAFNERVREVRKAAVARDSAYADLVNASGTVSTEVDVDPATFFNGVSFSEGQRRYSEYMANKAKKGGK